jgi:aminoglycoside phosphotransferase (APT) family kinase protein
MSGARMHADEVDTDADLVRRLLAGQFPHWAGLPIARVPSAGTDNALYRLGTHLVVRLPRIHSAVRQVALEHRWLPAFAPLLPVAVPEPLAMGEPAEGYPWHWSVYRWLDGENPTADALTDPDALAADLAGFVAAMRRIDPTDGPAARRGRPLVGQDAETRTAITALRGKVDTGAVTEVWDEAVRTPAWSGPPVWIHGDLAPFNVLVVDGRLSAVIDFGTMGTGDPACDLIAAWNLLPARVRGPFRAAVGVDDATWARGRGWALSMSLIALPYYHRTNPALAGTARHVIAEILAERRAAPDGFSPGG